MTNPIIIALDLESAEEARKLVRNVGDSCRFYKVGLELYAAAGRSFVEELLGEGNQVFLDLKMYDIGETVKRAVAQVAKLGVQFLTIHAVPQVMRAAMEGSKDSELKLLAVTVLTSLDDDDLHEMGVASSVAELVEKRVRQTVECKVHGLVCSPLEVGHVRQMTGPGAILVTPGVRSEGSSAGDQKRVATPTQAMAAGASYLVIGRQVTRSADPGGEVRRILSEIELPK
jgi:orotidine-5'-phosphate decarboxylase